MPELSYIESINQALHQEMERDENVFVLGEDVGEFGGAFKATAGLYDKFGRRRVLDTPMSEWAFIGLANGAAMMGLKPVVEIQFADFISTGFDPIVQYAATTHYRWGANIPLVIRAPWGGGACAGPFHSQCKEAWFTHCPGLKVVIPATPHDAKGLLVSAIRDPNPVIFFEPKYLYRRGRMEVPRELYTIPLGEASIRREGTDLSIITYGAMVEEALEAASTLSAEDISCEIIDLRTLVPLDKKAILESVRKTSRALIVHEAVRTGGFGAEVAAIISEEAFDVLDAPPARLTAPDTPVPYSPPLEKAFRPDAEKIAARARELAAY
ncbi:MAG: alpha-ketoacid dehydrogenase subunit beta [Planctomycetota bacterium]|nr:alpha-ketoacid dehydrogenase subunit beta [Planctomycetota bacterium]